jgi:hypothetical protein
VTKIPTPDELIRQLAGGTTSKIVRFLLNVASSTPFVGGVFSAAAAAWSEQEQRKVNLVIASLQRLTDDKVTELNGNLVALADSTQVAAARITFNPNTAELISGWGVSSFTDCGTLEFVVAFTKPVDDLVFTCYGSGPVSLAWSKRNPQSLALAFEAPAPERVTLVILDAAAA